MRHTASLLAMIVLIMSAGLLAFGTSADAATVRHRHHHRVITHRVLHHGKHAALTGPAVAAG
jgi:hypothetical protein